jgi:hypothetical protein
MSTRCKSFDEKENSLMPKNHDVSMLIEALKRFEHHGPMSQL